MNAKQELLEHIQDRQVQYVRVTHRTRGHFGKEHLIQGTLDEVLPLLDFDYHDGFGSQELFGTIWYVDGTWSERDEYDGSEWWTHRVRPPLPV